MRFCVLARPVAAAAFASLGDGALNVPAQTLLGDGSAGRAGAPLNLPQVGYNEGIFTRSSGAARAGGF